jgi:hypothetical protein
VSGDRTRPMPVPYPPARAARRQRRRWPLALLGTLVVLVLLLVGVDRAAAAYAGQRAAQQLQSQGFPGTPHVTMEGFPFLTQVISRNLRHVHLTAGDVQEGPVTATLVADATGVRLDPGYRSGVITRATGTILIGFSSVAGIARAAGAPGVTASAGGQDRIRFKVDLAVVSTTVIATVAKAGPGTLRLHIVSAGGLPPSLLGSFSNITFRLPRLPYGVTVRSVSVTSQGVVARLAAHDIPFGR